MKKQLLPVPRIQDFTTISNSIENDETTTTTIEFEITTEIPETTTMFSEFTTEFEEFDFTTEDNFEITTTDFPFLN